MQKDLAGLHPKTAKDYIPTVIGANEEEYWSNVGGAEAQAKLKAFPNATRIPFHLPASLDTTAAEEFSIGDQMVSALAATIEDEDTIVLGSFTPLAYAAYNLAKLTTRTKCFCCWLQWC